MSGPARRRGAPSAPRVSRDRTASIGGRPRTPSSSRAPRSSSSMASAPRRPEPARGGWPRRRAPRRGARRARRGPRARTGVAPEPDDAARRPVGAIGSTSRPRSSRSRAGKVVEHRLGRGPNRVLATEPERARRRRSLLCGETRGVELQRDRTAEPPASPDRLAGSAAASDGDDRQAGPGEEVEALAPPDTRPAVSGVPDAGSRTDAIALEPVATSIRGQRRPRRLATDRFGQRRARRPSQRATTRSRGTPRGPAQQRRPAALLVEHGLGLGRRLARGQRDVYGQDRRSVAVAARSWRVTSFAVATSDGSERYGKSWTRTSTSYAPDAAIASKHTRRTPSAGVVGSPWVERVADVAHRRQLRPGSLARASPGSVAGRRRSAARGRR